jgi:hypothetical protein
MNKEHSYTLPVGYHNFHNKQIYNFQFNRWHSLGFARFEDMKEAGERINNFSDWKHVMVELAQKAELEGRLKNAPINPMVNSSKFNTVLPYTTIKATIIPGFIFTNKRYIEESIVVFF